MGDAFLYNREKLIQVDFDLENKKLKPVFHSLSNSDNVEFVCMLDTGAAIPVWCSGEKSLMKVFTKAELREDLKSILSGFGTGAELVNVYYIPKIRICNGEETQYTKRQLSFEEVSALQKAYKMKTITKDTLIVGSEGEFKQILVQEDDGALVDNFFEK